MQERELIPVWRVYTHAIGVRSAPAPAAPHVAVGVAANAVREAGPEVGELLAPAHAGAVAGHIEDHDVGWVLRAIGRTRVDHIQFLEVRREAYPVRTLHRLHLHGRLAAWIETVHASRQFEFGFVSLVWP